MYMYTCTLSLARTHASILYTNTHREEKGIEKSGYSRGLPCDLEMTTMLKYWQQRDRKRKRKRKRKRERERERERMRVCVVYVFMVYVCVGVSVCLKVCTSLSLSFSLSLSLSLDLFGIPNPRKSGSVIGADR